MADVAVVVDGEEVLFAGAAEDAPPADDELRVEGFLMPAAADRHVHMGLADAGALVAGGVTAVRDLGSPAEAAFAMAGASRWPSFNGPLIIPSGPILTAPGGYPILDRWAPDGTGLELAEPEDAIATVNELADREAGQIKVALNSDAGPTLDDTILSAVVAAAHERGLPVTAHAQGHGQVERALGAGIDELAHAPWSELVPERILQGAAQTMRWVSTLDIHSFGADTPEVRMALDNIRRFRAVGGKVVYGTDLGNGSIPSRIHVRELMLMREAGMGIDDILEALIRAPLEAGEPADLLVLGESPFGDLGALDEPRLVMRTGRIVGS